jgi:hypothetical protein
MPETTPDPSWTKDPDRVEMLLGLLEARRASFDQSMWQAPTLTIAAQAFLLAVLTDDTIDDTARLWVLFAGVAACFAAILALIRLRAREVLHAEVIAYVLDKAALPDPRPHNLEPYRKESDRKPRLVDGMLRALGNWDHFPTVYIGWIIALVLFGIADVVAYLSAN